MYKSIIEPKLSQIQGLLRPCIIRVINDVSCFGSDFTLRQGPPRRTGSHVQNPREAEQAYSQRKVQKPRQPVHIATPCGIDVSPFRVHISGAAATRKKDTDQNNQHNHSPHHRRLLPAPVNKGPNNRVGNFPVNPTGTVAPSCELCPTGKLGQWPLRQRFAVSIFGCTLQKGSGNVKISA